RQRPPSHSRTQRTEVGEEDTAAAQPTKKTNKPTSREKKAESKARAASVTTTRSSSSPTDSSSENSFVNQQFRGDEPVLPLQWDEPWWHPAWRWRGP
ncbi:unnamed protein product, partial [Laminaria digitata]